MKVAILFDEVTPQDILDDKDVMQQVDVVVKSLNRLGHEYILLPCTLDLKEMKHRITSYNPDVTFNLLDTLDSKDCLSHLPIAVLDANGIEHTGPLAEDIAITTKKLVVKRILLANNIRFPCGPLCQTPETLDSKKWILKSMSADGSHGMSDKSVVSGLEVIEALHNNADCFAEEYIDGRELTVPFLCGNTLPVVEITYNDYPEGKPKILAQDAKWQQDSFEYQHTGVNFDITDTYLLESLDRITRKCISLFNLKGWGRIDFRVYEPDDVFGTQIPFVIDINTNCCLAPDAWWAGSLEHAGIKLDDAIKQILDEALKI